MPHFLVYEGATPQAFVDAVRERADPEIRVVQGWTTTSTQGAPLLCVGRVETAVDAAGAVLAAVAGAGLVVDAAGERDVIDRLCDDLRRLGTLEHQIGAPATLSPLNGEQRALLAELLSGRSLGEAARVLHISRRTADRRLASARAALGTTTTSEALIVAQGMGVGRVGAGRGDPAAHRGPAAP
jgi:DNA-binding CsgD family transcriptional regulator